MSARSLFYRVGHHFYKYAFLVYSPLYAAYKAYAERVEREVLSTVLYPDAVAMDAGSNTGFNRNSSRDAWAQNDAVHAFRTFA